MSLESHTLLVAAVLATSFMAGAHLVLWAYDRSHMGPLWMAIATLLCGVSALLREALPEREAIVVANVMLGLGLASIATACRVLCGRPMAWLPLALPSFAWMSACTFPAFMADQGTRSIASSLSCAVVMTWAIVELRHAGPGKTKARTGLVCVLGIQCVAAVARAVAIGLSNPGLQGVARTADVPRTTFWSFAFLLLMGFGVIFVVKEQSEQRLRKAVDEDALTGLANRRRLDLELDASWERAILRSRPVSLLMIDADAFKAYNDRYGHVAGDQALQAIARILARVASKAGGLAVRYGGEEFVILLPDADPATAYRVGVAARVGIRDADIEHSASPHGNMTISVGTASIIPSSRTRARDLLTAADKALYDAKRAGRDRVHRAYWPPFSSLDVADALHRGEQEAETARES